MIIVDKNTEVFDWVSGLNNEKLSCVRLDLVTFEIASGLQGELLLTHIDLLKELTSTQKKKFEACAGVIVFNSESKHSEVTFSNFLGFVDPAGNAENSINLLVNLEARVKAENVLKSQLISINHELNEIMGGVEGQLLRVKHTYEKMIPKRLEEFKGVKVFSKYAAGEKSGGEFFDLFTKDNKVFVLMSHTSSYLASSSILQSFGEFKQSANLTNSGQEKFLKSIQADVEQLAQSQGKDISIKLLTIILDLSHLEVSLKSLGNFNFYGSEDLQGFVGSDDEILSNQLNLSRGERLMICSPGFEFNWSKLRSNIDLNELVKNTNIKSLDVLDEAFFQLKKEAGSEFLSSDAASIILEVEQNVMVQM